jgi:3',5'-cyclic-AMP phosphodiesterase
MLNDRSERFSLAAPDASGVVSWIHIGDLHMVREGEETFVALRQIVAEINAAYAGKGVSFVYLPGDIADDGSAGAYAAVRACLDRLQVPWISVVGDHDVHERSFANYLSAMGGPLYGAFTVGRVRFCRLNAFSEPRPDAFVVDEEQLGWLRSELEAAAAGGLRAVVLMHCYPSDLKQGGEALTRLLRQYRVLLVDMGHTHYNELSDDGAVVYSATRSTGQIEEGPAGYSIVSVAGEDVSWQFVPVGSGPAVVITSPRDARLVVDGGERRSGSPVALHARAWSDVEVVRVSATAGGWRGELVRMPGANGWSAVLPGDAVGAGEEIEVVAEDAKGRLCRDRIRLTEAGRERISRAARDQDNAVGAWPEKGILGTQLGPNKNGKKW